MTKYGKLHTPETAPVPKRAKSMSEYRRRVAQGDPNILPPEGVEGKRVEIDTWDDWDMDAAIERMHEAFGDTLESLRISEARDKVIKLAKAYRRAYEEWGEGHAEFMAFINAVAELEELEKE